MSEQPPMGPDGAPLTPEEWDAVRRLRGERTAEAGPRHAAPPSAEPAEPVQPVQPEVVPEAAHGPQATPVAATAEPLPPVEPPPPPQETAPPVVETSPVEPPHVATTPAAPVMEPPVWGGAPARREVLPSAVPALAALVVLAVVMAVLAALVGLKVSDRHARDSASTAALSAASSGVATVLSYNYRSLDHDFATAEALLTPAFRKAYVATTAKAVQPLAAKYQAVSTAQVSAAGVISATPSRAVVLVFVSQTVTNTQLSAPRLDRSRIQVELVHTHGNWLINKLTPL